MPHRTMPPAIITILACAGLALTLSAQPASRQDQPRKDADARTTTPDSRNMDLRSCRWFKGRAIVNNANDSIGEVTDLVLDRGSGKILYVVADGKAALGNRSLIIPADAFRWEAAEGRLRLPDTGTALSRYPTFSEKEWKSLRTSKPPAGWYPGGRIPSSNSATGADPANNPDASPGTSQPSGLGEWMWTQPQAEGEAYMSPWDSTTRTTVEGEITKVNRVYSPPMGECVVVEVALPGGGTKNVALGPSWFVNGSEGVPTRGDKITVETVPLNIATDATINGKRVTLRDREGRGSWSGESFRHAGQSYSAPSSRTILASELRDAKIDCRGTRCGTVDDLIVDARTGSVAFLSIDPDQNFLGIGDTKRLVPWSVASVAMEGTVRLDATKEMLLASPKTPSTLSELNSSAQYDKVYNAYQIAPGRYDTHEGWGPGWGEGMNRRSCWDHDRTDRDPDMKDRSDKKDKDRDPKDRDPGTTPR